MKSNQSNQTTNKVTIPTGGHVLNLVGVGFKASIVKIAQATAKSALQQSNTIDTYLSLNLGYSHTCYVPIPNMLEISVIEATTICLNLKPIELVIRGAKREVKPESMQSAYALLCNYAALIRGIARKDVYKGKGIHNQGEQKVLKAVQKK